jgi:hypothetical protein
MQLKKKNVSTKCRYILVNTSEKCTVQKTSKNAVHLLFYRYMYETLYRVVLDDIWLCTCNLGFKKDREGVSPCPLAWKIFGLENAVGAISDAEKSISQRISECAI